MTGTMRMTTTQGTETTTVDLLVSSGLTNWVPWTPDLPPLREVVQRIDRVRQRARQLWAWTRAALRAWQLCRRQPIRLVLPPGRRPAARGRICSIAEAWRVRGPP